jgi:hypothetical protein
MGTRGGEKEDLHMQATQKIEEIVDIEEITLEEIELGDVAVNSAENSKKPAGRSKSGDKEKPVDVEIMATWVGSPTVRTKGHPERDGWWLVYHPDDEDWYYLPEKNVKPAPKRRSFKDIFKRQAGGRQL